MSRPSFLGIVTLFVLVIAIILFQLTMDERLEHIEHFISTNKFTMKRQHTTSPKTDLAAPQLEGKVQGEHTLKEIVTSAPNPITEPPPRPPAPVPATPDLAKTSPPDRPRTPVAPQLEEKVRGEHALKEIVTSAPNPITEPPPRPPAPVPATADLVKTNPPDRHRTAIVVPEPFDPFEGHDNLEIDEACRSLGKDTIISPNSKKWTCAD